MMEPALIRFEETFEKFTPGCADEARPQLTRMWRNELFRSNPMLHAPGIVIALRNLHRRKLSDDERLLELEGYRLAVTLLVEELQARFDTQPIPLTQVAKESVDVAQSLLQGLASGYMLCARNYIEDADPASDVDTLTLAIQRGIYHLGQVLLNAWLAYRPNVSGVWSGLYELYQHADQNDLLLKPVPMEDAGMVNDVTTILASFQQVVLMSTANPAGMQMGECGYLFDLLKRVELVEESNDHEPNSESVGIFAFDVRSDGSPLPQAATRDFEDAESFSSIDCLQTIQSLYDLLNFRSANRDAGDGQRTDIISLELLRKISERWAGTLIRRHSARSPTAWELPMCTGIAGIHYHASYQQTFSQFKREICDVESGFQNPALTEDGEFSEQDLQWDYDSWLWGVAVDGVESNVSADEAGVADGTYQTQTVRVMDESEGGVRLRLFTGSKVRLLVGNIVSLQTGAAGSWRAGVVRWLNASERHHVDAGIEFLSPNIEPVAVQCSEAQTGGTVLLPALLLRSNDGDVSETLVVPGGTHSIGTALKVIAADGVSRELEILESKLHTSSFEQVVINLE